MRKEEYSNHAFPNKYGAAGLTKREYFAAMALQGILIQDNYREEFYAETAVKLADALIEELEK